MIETLSPNTLVSHYSIIRKIGAGGMGEVYLAQDTRLDRKVALKILPPQVAVDPERMRRFVQEAKAASALNHPNIITIHEIDEANSIRFIATEFIEGETVRERLRKAPLKLNETIDIAIQAASALTTAHGAGIIHRDIKPENIMLRHDGIVKVLDFGLAKLTEEPQFDQVDTEAPTRANINTDPGVVMGTASYMSPEQAGGSVVDSRTDIFSLGAVIYEIVAGQLPFPGSNNREVIAAILNDKEPPPLARYARDVPAELERIVEKALRKDREARYQGVKDMLLDLRALKQKIEFAAALERSQSDSGLGAQVAHLPFPNRIDTNNNERAVATATTTSGAPAATMRTASALGGWKPWVAIAAILIVAAALLSYWLYFGKPSGNIDSIAVLPFENVTHDQNLEYLSDGVTESLINSLSQLPNVKVISRNSVFTYKNQHPNLQQVAKELNVQTLLTGRVLTQGDTLDVRVELTDTKNNTQLWGDHYTRKTADIFSVQDEIAGQVTDKLRVRLTGKQQEQVTKRYTDNEQAYRLYLQGRYYMNQGSEETMNRAVSFYGQALALDPRYALAYAARGETFTELADLTLPVTEANQKAQQDITTALGIDDKLVEARLVQANIKIASWDFAGSEQDFKQAIAANPNYAEAHHQYSYYLALSGKPLEAVPEIRMAQQLDPLNPGIVVDSTLPYLLGRQYDQALVESRRAVEVFPDFFLAHMALGNVLVEKGDYSAAIQELEKAKTLEPAPLVIGSLGYAYGKAGRKDEALKLSAELREKTKTRYVAAYWIAAIYAGLNEKDEAFNWLEQAYRDRSYWLTWLKMSPNMDHLRSDPRFNDLIRRVGFPP